MAKPFKPTKNAESITIPMFTSTDEAVAWVWDNVNDARLASYIEEGPATRLMARFAGKTLAELEQHLGNCAES